MSFHAVARRYDSMFIIVHESQIRENGLLESKAFGAIIDSNTNDLTEDVLGDSVVAHGHGTWDIRESFDDEWPSVQSLLERIGVESVERLNVPT